jgi:hypothetical protein
MQLVAYPRVFNRVFFFQLIDNSLADVAERSDIVGKYFEGDHLIPRFENILIAGLINDNAARVYLK